MMDDVFQVAKNFVRQCSLVKKPWKMSEEFKWKGVNLSSSCGKLKT